MCCYLIQGGGKKRYAGTAAEIPTAKQELLNFVNELCKGLDQHEPS